MSAMNDHCFVRQEATSRILENVSRFCAECYREFEEGEAIFYDMQGYRYLCESCAEALARHLDEACEVSEEEEEGGTLF
jgi:predicted amidophosphoribosyltransferase